MINLKNSKNLSFWFFLWNS